MRGVFDTLASALNWMYGASTWLPIGMRFTTKFLNLTGFGSGPVTQSSAHNAAAMKSSGTTCDKRMVSPLRKTSRLFRRVRKDDERRRSQVQGSQGQPPGQS